MSSLDLELDDAVNKADLNRVKKLLSKGANIEYIDSFGNTPLINAAWVASNEIVRLLKNKGANIDHQNNDGYTALEFIKTIGHNDYGHDNVIRTLQEQDY